MDVQHPQPPPALQHPVHEQLRELAQPDGQPGVGSPGTVAPAQQEAPPCHVRRQFQRFASHLCSVRRSPRRPRRHCQPLLASRGDHGSRRGQVAVHTRPLPPPPKRRRRVPSATHGAPQVDGVVHVRRLGGAAVPPVAAPAHAATEGAGAQAAHRGGVLTPRGEHGEHHRHVQLGVGLLEERHPAWPDGQAVQHMRAQALAARVVLCDSIGGRVHGASDDARAARERGTHPSERAVDDAGVDLVQRPLSVGVPARLQHTHMGQQAQHGTAQHAATQPTEHAPSHREQDTAGRRAFPERQGLLHSRLLLTHLVSSVTPRLEMDLLEPERV